MKFQSEFKHFIQEKALQNVVCEMASILSRPQCVNDSRSQTMYGSSQWETVLQWNIRKIRVQYNILPIYTIY